MKQIYIIGDSLSYGVGAQTSSFGDSIKSYIHSKLYSKNGIGEKVEVFNFSKGGVTPQFFIDNMEFIKSYAEKGEKTAIISIGLNSAKAVDTPNNYICSPEQFKQDFSDLSNKLNAFFDEIIVIGFPIHDEKKVSPKINPFNQRKSYFSNARTLLFNKEMEHICKENNFNYIDLEITSPKEWVENYLYDDGLHLNQKGHDYTFGKIKPCIDSVLIDLINKK
jgi:lysophospholipase L1-like esterase